MGTRIDLPSGGWAELIDPATIRGAHRKKAQTSKGFVDAANAQNAIGSVLALTPAIANVGIERYCLPYAPFNDVVRVNMIDEDWDNLTIPDIDALEDALEPIRALLFPKIASIDDTKPGSPTLPADA